MNTIQKKRKTRYASHGANPRRRNSRGKNKRSRKELPLEVMKSLSIQPEETVKQEKYAVHTSFNDLGLHAPLKAILKQKGYNQPTEIQDRSFDFISKGSDFLGVAQTGTGKTAAFLIPLINRMIQENFKVLIVVPTRELAEQINTEFRSLSRGFNLFSTCLIGGTNVKRNLDNLRKKNDFIIGTPGRITDMSQRKALKLHEFEVLVLDEFDRLLDMGFSKDIDALVAGMVNKKQTLLFSATLEKEQKKKIDALLNDPEVVKVHSGANTAANVEQKFITVGLHQEKFDVLNQMLLKSDFDKVLVFAETKRAVNRLCKSLKQNNISADEIHGDKTQSYRQQALRRFKGGKVRVLVATDVAARGLDITNVTHVINYQIPQTVDSYIHRIGRTGRAGKKGKAFTFVN
ncbi:MAG: DEAD/DEAH box helicase [Bacteroidota bacterium]